MKIRKSTVVLVGLAVLVSGCGVASRAQDADGPGTQPSARPSGPAGPVPVGLEKFYQQQPDWERCGSGQLCATISVPLDYEQPTGKAIELRARKVPARDRTGKIGTLFLNPGGPGGSGLEYAAAAAAVLGAAVLRKFDVIGWDPRGVGESTPVRCLDTAAMDNFVGADGSPDDEAEIAALDKAAKVLADGCEQRSGELLPHVVHEGRGPRHGRDARHRRRLRAVLPRQVLRHLPRRDVRRAVPEERRPAGAGRRGRSGEDRPSRSTSHRRRASTPRWTRSPSDCASRSCSLGSSRAEVLAKVDKVLADSDATPLPGDGNRTVTQGLAVLGVIFPLYVKDYWPRLEKAVADGVNGDGAPVARAGRRVHQPRPSGYADNSGEVIYAVNCVDHPDITSVADAKAEGGRGTRRRRPGSAPYLLWGSLPCANWPVKPKDTPHAIKAPGAKPIVVVGTTRDPATPYEWSRRARGQLDSGVLVTRDGDGHTGYREGNDCVDDAVESYLLKGTAPSTDLKC